jgi:hypothetical protein
VPVAHAYNASYSGGRDPEELQFEANSRQIVHETISEKLVTHKELVNYDPPDLCLLGS